MGRIALINTVKVGKFSTSVSFAIVSVSLPERFLHHCFKCDLYSVHLLFRLGLRSLAHLVGVLPLLLIVFNTVLENHLYPIFFGLFVQ